MVDQGSASSIYSQFIREVARSKQAWCLTCHGDVCVVHGASGHFMLPLWPDARSARYFTSLHWPHLQPSRLVLRDLLWSCLVTAVISDIPAGVGVAPEPEAVVVPAQRLRRDLIAARLRGPTTFSN